MTALPLHRLPLAALLLLAVLGVRAEGAGEVEVQQVDPLSSLRQRMEQSRQAPGADTFVAPDWEGRPAEGAAPAQAASKAPAQPAPARNSEKPKKDKSSNHLPLPEKTITIQDLRDIDKLGEEIEAAKRRRAGGE